MVKPNNKDTSKVVVTDAQICGIYIIYYILYIIYIYIYIYNQQRNKQPTSNKMIHDGCK